MFKIQYTASYDAIHIHSSMITLSLPSPVVIQPGGALRIDCPIAIQLSDDWDCRLNINPLAGCPVMLLHGELPYKDIQDITLYNPSTSKVCIDEGTDMFRLDFYKQSIVLSGISYDKNSNTCSFGFEQLESSYVRVPVQHLQFENLYIQETK